MKAVLGMLPYAVVLAVGCVAIWWLVSHGMAAGKWLLAAVIVAHAAVHLLYFVPAPSVSGSGTEWPFALANSWPVASAGLDVNLVRAVALAASAVLVCAFAVAGLATVGVVVPTSWWPAAVIVGSIASIATLVFLFNPQLVLGLGIDSVLLWVVVANAWRP
jgi:hypothetical protein